MAGLGTAGLLQVGLYGADHHPGDDRAVVLRRRRGLMLSLVYFALGYLFACLMAGS
jgi:hypothetical protein